MDDVIATLRDHPDGPQRLLVTGWFSFEDGQVTAGDVLALRAAEAALTGPGPRVRHRLERRIPAGRLHLEAARPQEYGHLLFVCVPLHGEQISALHRRSRPLPPPGGRRQRRRSGRAGGDRLPPGSRPGRCGKPPGRPLGPRGVGPLPPVVGVVLTEGQGEYGAARRHESVGALLRDWVARRDCARVPAETRLDSRDWRLRDAPGAVPRPRRRLGPGPHHPGRTDWCWGCGPGCPCWRWTRWRAAPRRAPRPALCAGPPPCRRDTAGEPLLDRWWTWCLSPAGPGGGAPPGPGDEAPWLQAAGGVSSRGTGPSSRRRARCAALAARARSSHWRPPPGVSRRSWESVPCMASPTQYGGAGGQGEATSLRPWKTSALTLWAPSSLPTTADGGDLAVLRGSPLSPVSEVLGVQPLQDPLADAGRVPEPDGRRQHQDVAGQHLLPSVGQLPLAHVPRRPRQDVVVGHPHRLPGDAVARQPAITWSAR